MSYQGNLLFAGPPTRRQDKAAVVSDDGLYRYLLTRRWNHFDLNGPEGKRVVWVMLNPSTADATYNDATIRRCIGYSKSWGYSSLDVVNLFALRSTDPKRLYEATLSAVGPRNDEMIRQTLDGADLVVCAWGTHGALHNRDQEARRLIREAGHVPMCLTTTKAGHPGHPVRLPASLVPVPLDR